MRIVRNCHAPGWRCPYLRNPFWHAGYTGKSGTNTWWKCVLLVRAIRHIVTCPLAGQPKAQQEHYADHEAIYEASRRRSNHG